MNLHLLIENLYLFFLGSLFILAFRQSFRQPFSPDSFNTKTNLINKLTIRLFLSLSSKRVPTSSSFLPCAVTPGFFQTDPFLPISAVTPTLSLPNLYFCTIRSIMFLKVLNNVNIKALTQTYIVSYYQLTPICKTLGFISY